MFSLLKGQLTGGMIVAIFRLYIMWKTKHVYSVSLQNTELGPVGRTTITTVTHFADTQ